MSLSIDDKSDDLLDFIPFDQKDLAEDDDGQPEQAPALVTSTPAPWLAFLVSNNDRRVPPLVRMHNEILTLCEYIAPSTKELRVRDSVLAEITEVVNSLWPEAKVQVFGSQLTKILTPASDLDIAVLGVPEDAADHPTEVYLKLAERFRAEAARSGMATYVEAIVKAKVPIVKLDHARSGLSVDICINNDSGSRTGALIRRYVREYPPLRPLTLVLKLFLSQRRLNDTYTGGIGSFLLTLMIVSFLQNKQKLDQLTLDHHQQHQQQQQGAPLASTSSSCGVSWNLGALLLEFFQLYGGSFNYYTTAISVANGGRYLRKRKLENFDAAGSQSRPNLLYVENPDCPELDVGRSSFMLPKIRRAFEHAHQVLCTALTDRRAPSYLAFVIRPDDPALQDRPRPELADARTNAQALLW